MAIKYYVGNNVPLEFHCIYKYKGGQTGKTPTVATVIITKPDDSKTTVKDATIDTYKVTYVVPVSVTDQTGVYTAIFTLTIDGNVLSNAIEFTIH